MKQRICAYDPASGDMGMAVLDCQDGMCTIIHTEDINGGKLVKDKNLKKTFKDIPAFCVSMAYQGMAYLHARRWKPDAVVVERAFVFSFPQVLITLTLIIHGIRSGYWIATGKNINIVSPMETKKIIARKGNAKKPEIKAGVLSSTNLVFLPQIDKEHLSEHVYDAIGHGYAWYTLQNKK